MSFLEEKTYVEEDKNVSAVTQIVNAIKRMIIDQKLKVDDKIPNEFELSEQFGKSRGCVREAVKILESFGVLDVRRGDGTYVKASVSSGMFDALFFQIIAKGTKLSELIQLRLILELGIIELVLGSARKNDVDNLKRIEKELRGAIYNHEPIEKLLTKDIALHTAIVEITGNEILKNVYVNMLDIFTPFIRYSYYQQEAGEDYSVLKHHDLMIEAIEEKDYDLAKYAVRNSLKDWEKLNIKYLTEDRC